MDDGCTYVCTCACRHVCRYVSIHTRIPSPAFSYLYLPHSGKSARGPVSKKTCHAVSSIFSQSVHTVATTAFCPYSQPHDDRPPAVFTRECPPSAPMIRRTFCSFSLRMFISANQFIPIFSSKRKLVHSCFILYHYPHAIGAIK